MKKQHIGIVSKRIRERRKELGMTQADLAEHLEVNIKTIVTIEQMSTPTFATDRFISLCTILDCSPDYLMGIDELPHRENTDIHIATGLSDGAIDLLMGLNDYRDALEKQGHEPALKHSADYGLIIDFISCLITNVDYDIMLRHIRSLAWSQIYEDLYAGLEIDDARLESAVICKEPNDMAYVSQTFMTAQELHQNSISSKDTADATAWRFSQMVARVLDSFSKEQMLFIKDQINKEEKEVDAILNEKDIEGIIAEREVLTDEKR